MVFIFFPNKYDLSKTANNKQVLMSIYHIEFFNNDDNQAKKKQINTVT